MSPFMNKCLILCLLSTVCSNFLLSSEDESNSKVEGIWHIKAVNINDTEYKLEINKGEFILSVDSDSKVSVMEDEVFKEAGTNKGRVITEGNFLLLKAGESSGIPFQILWMVKSKNEVVALYPVEKLDSVILGSGKIEEYVFKKLKTEK